jgi:hypothetical protein
MSKASIMDLFKVETSITQIYPHGFVDAAAKLPADFNELGIRRFLADLKRFPSIEKEIILSLNQKVVQLGDVELVVPELLRYLLV